MDLNVRDHDGRAPLHWAAQMGDVCLSQALVEAGADPLALSAAGSAPWEEGGSHEVVEYLESAALAAREARELFGLWGDKSRAAGEAALALIATGRMSIDGAVIDSVGDLLKAAGERGKGGKSGRSRQRL
jgi:ankyrin repeat protein